MNSAPSRGLRWRDWPLPVKLAVLLIGVAILPLAIMSVATELSARAEVRSDARARNLQRVQHTASLLRGHLDNVVGDVRLLAQAPVTLAALQELADSGSDSRLPELRATLSVARAAKGHDALSILNPLGRVVASTDPAMEGRNRIADPFFLWANAGQAGIHDPRYMSDDRQVHINASVPVRRSDGQVIGVALSRISFTEIDRLVAADSNFAKLGEYGLLWDERGIVLSSAALPERRFRPLGRLQAFARERIVADQRFGPDTSALMDDGIGGEELVQFSRWRTYDATGDPHGSLGFDGERFEVVSVPIGVQRWSYGIAVAESRLMGALDGQRRRNLLVAAAASLLALVLGLAAASWVSQPLEQVRAAASALAAGDMSRRAGLQRGDEIGELAATFDRMADALAAQDAQLRRHAEDLERRVEDRTADLRRSEERTGFLSSAGAAISESLDQDSIAGALARLAVPVMGTFCMVDLVAGDGMRSAAIAATDPEIEERLRLLRAEFPPSMEAPSPALEAVRTGQSRVFFPEQTGAVRSEVASNQRHRELLDSFPPVAGVVVPLVARGEKLGAMTFGSFGLGRRYGDADLSLAQELGGRAAIALENARLYREVQETSRLKDEFLGVVSHELRTPLNALLGWTHLLRRGGLDGPQGLRALDAVERNARAQAQLVEDLLDTSRVISGKLSISLGPTDVAAVVEQAVESFRPLAASKRITIDCEPGAPMEPIEADPARLHQVIGNLLSNAVKFTPDGGTVTITVARRVADVEIRISDTGAGIAPEFLPFVFERFRQADSTTTRAHGGLGIGLAIARHLVGLHGGSIRAESDGENRGATFSVRIPAVIARVPRGAPSEQPSLDPPMLNGVRVLIVDDDADARELLRTAFVAAHAEVETVASADEALAALAASRPDALVSDIGLPGRDGYALIREVREDEHQRGLPPVAAIAVSAYARSEDHVKSLRAGYDRHVAKPVIPSAVVAAVHAVVIRRLSREET